MERRRRKGQRLPDNDNIEAVGITEPRRGKMSSNKNKSSSKTKGRSLMSPAGGLKYSRVPSLGPEPQERNGGRFAAVTGNPFLSSRDDALLEEAQSQIALLKEQMVALKVHNRELEEELKNEKLKKDEKRYREELEELEEENLDMQHDLAETRKIKNRLERENRVLGKKLVKREAENSRLQDRIDDLIEVTGSERNANKLEHDTGKHTEQQSPRKLERSSTSSLWKLLADETVPASPVCTSSHSKSSIFDGFFKSPGSMMTNSSTDISIMTGLSAHSRADGRSAHCRNDDKPPLSPCIDGRTPPQSPRNDGRQIPFRLPQGGFVPAA